MNKLIIVISTLCSVAAHAAPTPCSNSTEQINTVKEQPVCVMPDRQEGNTSDHVDMDSVEMVRKNKQQHDPVTSSAANTAHTPKHGTGLYLGIEGIKRDVNLNNNGQVGYQWAEHKRARGKGARLSLGYKVNDNVALELGYMTGFSIRDHKTYPMGVVSYDASARVTGGDVSVIYHFTDYLPGVYVRGGASYMQVSGTSVTKNRMEYRARHNYVFPDKKESNRHSGLGVVAGIGYETAVTDHMHFNVGYTRYQGIAGDKQNAINLFSVGGKYHF